MTPPEPNTPAWHEIHGAWRDNDPRRIFVDGAKWWEFVKTGGTMWRSDQDRAEAEAERRFPDTEAKKVT